MKILFITHNSSRSGAPYVLVLLLKWLQENEPNLVCDVVDLNPGALAEDFKKSSTTYYAIPKMDRKENGLLHRAWRKLSKTQPKTASQLLIASIQTDDYDMVYANTVKTIPFASKLLKQNSKLKLVAHIHELPTTINLLLPDFKNYLSQVDHFISVSNKVDNALHRHWDIALENITTVYPFSEEQLVATTSKKTDTFIVGASGKVDWRKGHDVFLQTARHTLKHHPDISVSFVWVGKVSARDRLIIEADIKKLGLENTVKFVGEQENPFPYFQDFDVFLMPSREDPFPLVCIEMAQLKKPIICFEGAVGTSEFLEQGGGKVVPYLDIEAMAAAVADYYKNPELRAADGEIAYTRFKACAPDKKAPEILEILEKVASQ